MTPRRPSPVPHTRTAGLLAALGAAAISGLAIFTNSYGVAAFGNTALYTTAKNLVAGVLLLAVLGMATARRSAEGFTRPDNRRQWLGLAAVGVFGGAIPFLLFFEGLARASSADAAFLHKTLVVWVALLAVPLLRERVGPLQLGAIGLLVLGQVAILGHLPSISAGSGELMILTATLLWSGEVVLAKHLLRDLSAWTVGTARLGIGVVVLVGWSLLSGASSQLTSIAASQWGWVLLTGAILTAYVATWFFALARAPAIDVTAVLVTGWVITALFNAGLKGAALAPDALGLGLLVAGTVVILRSRPPVLQRS